MLCWSIPQPLVFGNKLVLTTIRNSIYTNRIWIVNKGLETMKNRQELDKNSHTKSTNNPPIKNTQSDAVVEMRYLARSWLDQFEKQVFEGKTIDELLNTRTYD